MTSRKFLYIIIYILAAVVTPTNAQHRSDRSKLSPWLRSIAAMNTQHQSGVSSRAPSATQGKTVCAFIKTTEGGENVLTENGCKSLARFGNIHIATIPIDRLTDMSHDHRVKRIEASPTGHALTDSMAIHLNATDVYLGTNLPQAYTGKGIVMGLMDVGFDLTHPNFYSRDTTNYRIRRFWDQLSQDTIGSPFPVGRDYMGKDELLALGHSRDGLDITHGTHTLGIAAGSGYNTQFRGMAPETDICIVANAVGEDLVYIDSADVYKYTFATDALGFKYIFDYAEMTGQPCVISFSEGSPQDFYGYDQLYYEILDSLTGPGRILVAAAGNEGIYKSYMHKPRGRQTAGTFLRCARDSMTMTARSADVFSLRIKAYTDEDETILLRSNDVLATDDSTLLATLQHLSVRVEAFPSCYEPRDICYDITVFTEGPVGQQPRISLELLGSNADVDLWRVDGYFIAREENPLLDDTENTHNIHSPSSAPCVICVGATTQRSSVKNYREEMMGELRDTLGRLSDFSSRGPTMDGRIKPDCVAPGKYIISSYSSYFLENHPTSSDINWDVAHFDFNGRMYAWNANTGTSSSSPAVGGAIALWLQACPTLSPQDVLGVLKRTSRHPDPALDYPNNMYGYGQIDVYAGLLDVLGLTAIRDIPQEHTHAKISIADGQLVIVLPQATTTPLTLRIYDLSGRPVLYKKLEQGSEIYRIPLPQLSAGVYAVCIADGSTLVRL